MASGREGSVGLGAETSWGTGVAPSHFYNATETITEERQRLREAMSYGTRSRSAADEGRLRINGGIAGIHAKPVGLGHLLRAAFGDPDTTGVGPYVHVFTPVAAKFSEEAALPPYSVTVNRAGELIQRYLGGQVNRLVLNQPADDALVVDADFVFKGVEEVAAPVLAVEQGSRFRFHQLAVTLDGAPFTALESVQITLDNALEVEETLNGTNEISAVDFGQSSVQVALTASFREATLYDEFVANTTLPLLLTWTNGADILEISLPRLNVTSWQAPISGPGRMTVQANAEAEFDATAGHDIEVTLTNTEETY